MERSQQYSTRSVTDSLRKNAAGSSVIDPRLYTDGKAWCLFFNKTLAAPNVVGLQVIPLQVIYLSIKTASAGLSPSSPSAWQFHVHDLSKSYRYSGYTRAIHFNAFALPVNCPRSHYEKTSNAGSFWNYLPCSLQLTSSTSLMSSKVFSPNFILRACASRQSNVWKFAWIARPGRKERREHTHWDFF